MKNRLLSKALSFKRKGHDAWKGTMPSGEELELAIARATHAVSALQVMHAIGANNRQSADAWVGRILARAILFGMLGRK